MMNLTLCCISNVLASKNIKFQSMTYTRFKSLPFKEAIKILSDRIYNNFTVTHKTIKHCHQMGISGYRLSSDLIPVLNHPELSLDIDSLPNSYQIYELIDNISDSIKKYGMRISAHPSEYISLTSLDDIVIQNSKRDLEQHALLFDLLDLPNSHQSPINIHCRQEGDPSEVASRFLKNFESLSDSVKNRLVVENNDNKDGSWHIENLYEHFFKTRGLPITFDNLHHSLLPGRLSDFEAFELAYSTWDCVPAFHHSEGINGTKRHADYALARPRSYGKEVFWECELKAKDLAILELLRA